MKVKLKDIEISSPLNFGKFSFIQYFGRKRMRLHYAITSAEKLRLMPVKTLGLQDLIVLLVLLTSSLKVLGVLLIGGLGEGVDGPQIGGQELVGVGQSIESRTDEVTLGLGVTSRGSVNVSDTSEGDHLLRGRGTNDVSSSGGGDELDSDRTALTGDLHGDSVGSSELVTPVASSDGDHGQLSGDDTSLNGVSNFLTSLHTETNVSVLITNGNESLEAGSLTG